MEENQIYEKIDENMNNLEELEREIDMSQLALYQKETEKLKESKVKELKDFFEQQANFYNQKTEKYQAEIQKNVKKYEEQIDQLINVYNNIYVNAFRIMQTAVNNQRIAVANIVTLVEKKKNKSIDEDEQKKIQRVIIACAQKKLNYGVIIDECNARIQWCIENIQTDINELFKNNATQIQVYEKNIFIHIKQFISNKISGQNKYKRVLNNYENKELKKIRTENNTKILDLCATLKGILKQMEMAKEQISEQYEQMVA